MTEIRDIVTVEEGADRVTTGTTAETVTVGEIHEAETGIEAEMNCGTAATEIDRVTGVEI